MPITNSLGNRAINSVSGENAVFLIDHTSNTASSNAFMQMNTAGTSAGDNALVHTVSGVQSWSRGQDNSDFQCYAISANSALGTTNTVRVSASGHVNYPLTSSYRGYLPATASNVTGSGGNYNISSYTELLDQAANFNPTTGVFTVPRDGYYFIGGTVQTTQLTAAMTSGAYIIEVNGLTQTSIGYNFGAAMTVGTTFTCNFSWLGPLSSGDTVNLSVTVAGGTAVVDVVGGANYSTIFYGQLLA